MVFSNGGSSAQSEQPKPQPAVTEEELGTARDTFETYRKLTFEGLLADEERAKQSGDLSDKERNKLLGNSVETWKVFLRNFVR